MAKKKSFLQSGKLPLMNISITKLAFAVVVGSLLTISMFMLEHRSEINQTTIAKLIENRQTTVNLTINNEPAQKVTLISGFTAMDLFKSQINTASLSANWSYTVNGKPTNVDASRYALYDGDNVVWYSKK